MTFKPGDKVVIIGIYDRNKKTLKTELQQIPDKWRKVVQDRKTFIINTINDYNVKLEGWSQSMYVEELQYATISSWKNEFIEG